MYSNLHFYIDIDWEKFVIEQNVYSQRIYEIIDFIYQYKAKVYYSELQIKDICYLDLNYTQSNGNKLGVILENANPVNQNHYSFEICFSSKNTTFNYIDNKIINSISSNERNALISFSKIKSSTILGVKSSNEFEKINFYIFNNVKNILDWINKLSVRNFNKSDKHGENGKGNWKNESVLLCSENEASKLLKSAIPDFRVKNRLFNYDRKLKTYIEFYYEGKNPSNQWHGFHLKKEEWENRVPISIRKFYKKL